MQGDRGPRWLRDSAIRKHGREGAYLRWTWLAKAGRAWVTMATLRTSP